MPNEFIPCGGCGAKSPNDRCIGCMHDFGEQASLQNRVTMLEQHVKRLTARWSMLTSELDKSLVEAVERVSDENQQLRELAREWCEAFETSNVKAIPDLIRRTRELDQ